MVVMVIVMVMAVEKVFSDKCQTELILGEVPGRQWGQQDRQGEIITFLYFEQQIGAFTKHRN